MRRWKPQAAFGSWIAATLLILALISSVAAALRLEQALTGPPLNWQLGLGIYLWLILLLGLVAGSGFLAYRLASALTLSYELDRNGLYINWLGNRAIVPLDQIVTLDIGATGAQVPWRLLQGIGSYWGQGQVADARPLYLFASQPLRRCLIVYTAEAAYAISPQDQDTFVQDLEQRRSLGAIKPLTSSVMRGRLFFYAFWNDHVVRGALALALLLNLAILAFLFTRYSGLAPSLPMQFDPAGATVGLKPKYQIFYMPLAALALSLLNIGLGLWLYKREKNAARLLQLTSVLVHVLFGVACVGIVLGLTA